jgi:hypothetical protein
MSRKNNFLKYHELRKDFPVFIYDDFSCSFEGDSLEITFSFSLPGKHHFRPFIKIPYKKEIFRSYDSLSREALANLIFHIGMIEMISYWKAACPPRVIIRPRKLGADALAFWKKIYFHGLGEFFYLNSIPADEEDFMELECQSDQPVQAFAAALENSSLVPVGGGKDSALTMGMLSESGFDWFPMMINPSGTGRAVIGAAGKAEVETIDIFRSIDPHLLEMNEAGFLNGHTPFSALLAFYSLLAAYLSGRSDIILSNESSANEATVPGTSINHQYSKTLEFETDFRKYTERFISKEFNYFSLLRPLSELQIACLFAKMKPFHALFRSCNVGSKNGTWCGHCPKCLFTFIILSPFLDPGELIAIFGRNLLDDPSLENILQELTGKAAIKPFECIGTVDEVNLALQLSKAKYRDEEMPYLLDLHSRLTAGFNAPVSRGELLSITDSHHCVSERYLDIIKRHIHDQPA